MYERTLHAAAKVALRALSWGRRTPRGASCESPGQIWPLTPSPGRMVSITPCCSRSWSRGTLRIVEAAVRVDVRDEVPGDEAISPGGSHGGEDGKQGPKVRVHGLSVQTHTRAHATKLRCHAVRTYKQNGHSHKTRHTNECSSAQHGRRHMAAVDPARHRLRRAGTTLRVTRAADESVVCAVVDVRGRRNRISVEISPR